MGALEAARKQASGGRTRQTDASILEAGDIGKADARCGHLRGRAWALWRWAFWRQVTALEAGAGRADTSILEAGHRQTQG